MRNPIRQNFFRMIENKPKKVFLSLLVINSIDRMWSFNERSGREISDFSD